MTLTPCNQISNNETIFAKTALDLVMFSKIITNSNRSNVFLPVGLLAVFIVFKAKFEQIFTSLAVKSFLAFVRSDWSTDAVFFLAILVAIVFFVRMWRESVWVAPANLGYLLVGFAILLWYRITQAPWNFIPFRTTEVLKYTDVVLFIIMLVIAMMFRAIFRKKPEVIPKGFLEGLPLGEGGIDKLGYSSYAKRVADRINESLFEKSFAIGITGEWGVGKTSFVNLLEKQLDKSKTIVINFNAWNSSSTNDIIKDFFAVVSSKVSESHTELSNLLISYAHELTKNELPLWSQYTRKIIGDSETRPPAWYQHKISNALPYLKKRLVVCIDELDRLNREELVEVVRLIRNTANLPNVVFIVTYDRNYVINALKETDRLRSEYFLEKIFQMEITLPRYGEDLIKSDLREKLIKAVNNPVYATQIDKALDKSFPGEVSVLSYIKTLRDVNKLVNAVFLNLDPIMGEIVLEDLLLLELIKIKYPSVYELLYKQKDKFLTIPQGHRINDQYILFTGEQGEFTIIEFIERYKEQLSIEQKEIPNIKVLLNAIFPATQGYRQSDMLSVRKPTKFGRYFSLRLSEKELSEAEFKEAFSGAEEKFNEYIKLAIQKGQYYELVDRLNQETTYESSFHFKRLIDAIFLVVKQSASTLDFSFNLANKLSDKNGRIAKLYGKNVNIPAHYVKQKFLAAEEPLLAFARLAAEARNLMIDDDYILTGESLDEILLEYLKRHLATIDRLDRDAWEIYWCCKVREWHTDASRNRFATQKFIAGASEAFVEFIKTKDFIGFLRAIVYRSFESSTHAKIEEQPVIELFGSWQAFKAFLYQQRTEEKQYVQEFIALFEQLEAKSFSEEVKFEFKELFDFNGGALTNT